MAGLLLAGIAFQAWGPQVLGRFVDQAAGRAAAADLTRTALLFLGVALAGQAVAALGVYLSTRVAWEATNHLRADLALHCLRLDLGFHHAHVPGEMIQRIDGDVGVLGNFFSQFTVQVAANSILVAAALGLILRENAWAGVILALYVAGAFRLLLRVQKAGGASFSRARALQGQAVGFWEEMLTAREDVQPLDGAGYVLRRNWEIERAMWPLDILSFVLFRAYTAAFAAVFVIGNAIAFAVGAWLYGQGQMTLGGVFLLLTYTNLLASKVGSIANQSSDYEQAVVAIRRVTELSSQTSALQDGSGAVPDGKAPAVAFENVSFAYPVDPARPGAADGPRAGVLHGLSFSLEGGQRLGLLGRTGAGKSTIVRLLFRFYDPDQGAVRLNGVDLRQLRLDELRGAIGMVTQEVQLFHASTRDNLTLFDPRITDERIREVLREVGLEPWLRGLPQDLDSVLSGSAGLSAGEAQLLAVARVFLQDPRLVILDEASARLDLATEARLDRAVERLLRGRTAIIIAHRLNTLRKVDQVLVLEQGRLVEYGPRARLAADPASEYHRLQRLGVERLAEP